LWVWEGQELGISHTTPNALCLYCGSLPVEWVYKGSCEEVITLNLAKALPKASTVSTSKWFVGSSKRRKLGLQHHMRRRKQEI